MSVCPYSYGCVYICMYDACACMYVRMCMHFMDWSSATREPMPPFQNRACAQCESTFYSLDMYVRTDVHIRTHLYVNVFINYVHVFIYCNYCMYVHVLKYSVYMHIHEHT